MIEDGIYLDLPEDQYHALNALSASGIKNLLISQPDYWFRSPMNPNRQDENTDAMMIGKAFHKRILEGKEAFYSRYAVEFQAPEGCLKTIDDIKGALQALGVETKVCKCKADYVARLQENNPDAVFFDVAKDDYETEHLGKEFLSPDLLSSIEISAAMIEKHPEISKCFTGGYPEVSIIWTEDGVRMKARLDYLKPSALVDLKTFANTMNKPIDAAIYSAMASGKYHIQIAFYARAIERAKDFIRSGEFLGVPEDWRDKFLSTEEHGCYLVFQQKGIAPLARCKKLPREGLFQSGVMAIEHAIQIYKACMEKYGELPWLDEYPIDEFSDALMPPWATEI